MKRQQLVCLQIHNDYQIPGGETKTAVGIANLLEKNNITVIRYYKDNKSFAQKGKINRIIVGIKSIYNKDTVEDIEKIIDKYHIDFALIHNVLPIISNSVYKVLYKYNIPVIKYIQNYNLVCLNGALDHGDKCEKCKKHSCRTGIKCKCYKNSFMYTLIRYMCKRQFDRNYLNQISAFMPNSNFVKNRHAEYGMKTDKMHVMYNYIECDTNEISERNHNSYYLYFGRISKEKGIFTIVEAFKKLDNLQLVFMGMGEDESKLK